MRINEMVLFATCCGDLYKWHIQSAKANKLTWTNHVKTVLIPKWRREHHEPYDGMSLEEIDQVAHDLKRYYREHVKHIKL